MSKLKKPTIEIQGLSESILKENKYIDYILGTIYGSCLGDAYGVSTFNLMKRSIDNKYPDPTSFINFPNYQKYFENSRSTNGDWGYDTDAMILILQSIIYDNNGNGISNDGLINTDLLAAKLKKYNSGNAFTSELGTGRIHHVRYKEDVISDDQFLNNPYNVSKSKWLLNKTTNPNSIKRSTIIPCLDFLNDKIVLTNTINCSKLTNFDPATNICCILYSKLLSTILKYHFNNIGNTGYGSKEYIINCLDFIIGEIDNGEYEKIAQYYLDDNGLIDQHTSKSIYNAITFYLNKVKKFDWSMLELNDALKGRGHPYYPFGSSIYCLRKFSELLKQQQQNGEDRPISYSFRFILDKLIREGGDNNGSTAGALLGSVIGYSNLPKDMLTSLPNKSWLDIQVVKFINLIVNRNNNNNNNNIVIPTTLSTESEFNEFFKNDKHETESTIYLKSTPTTTTSTWCNIQ